MIGRCLSLVVCLGSRVALAAEAPVPAPLPDSPRQEPPGMEEGLAAPDLPFVGGGGVVGVDVSGDRMDVNAGAGQSPGAAAGSVGGSDAAVIRPEGAGQPVLPGVFPAGTNAAAPVTLAPAVGRGFGFGGVGLRLAGFVDAELATVIFDNHDYDMTFLPRETELDVEVESGSARLRIDANLILGTDSQAVSTVSPLLDRDLFDALIEQAWVEYSVAGVNVRAGKMAAPSRSEALDVVDRLSLSRSSLAQLAAPSTLTGLCVDYALLPTLGVYATVVNGWDTTVEADNRSKTLGLGLPHRAGSGARRPWAYEGDLSLLVGAERPGVNDLRWVVTYSGHVELTAALGLRGALVYGEEEGEGYSKKGDKDRLHAAQWYGGVLAVELEPTAESTGIARDLKGDLRLEYLRDPDLRLDLPRRRNLPSFTTLVGGAGTLRYIVADSVDAGVEYRIDFERGDVKNVSVQRGGSGWNVFEWFVTQEVLLSLIGRF